MKESSKEPRKDLQAAIDELVRRKKAKEIPDRQIVRLAFLALGRIGMEEGEDEGQSLAPALQQAAELHEERWDAAVASEMSLAVAEHVLSVDPHYLELPGYDFAYTVAARERLEARLHAAELLGIRIEESLLDQITAADERLQPYLDRSSED